MKFFLSITFTLVGAGSLFVICLYLFVFVCAVVHVGACVRAWHLTRLCVGYAMKFFIFITFVSW